MGDCALLFHSQLTWTVYPNGSIALQTAITSTGPVPALPKIGARMELSGSLSNVVWLGRGPWENYPDRKTAARVSPPLVAPVALRKREVVLTSPTPGAAIKYRINEGPEWTATAPIPAVSGAGIVAWAERAGFQPSCQTVLQLPAIADKSRYAIHYVSSQQPDEGEAAHLIDSDPDTYWHTEYGLTLSKHPHTVDIDLGEMKSFRGITCLPRQDNVNGRVIRYQFAVSDDTKTWAAVAQEKFPDGTASQTVELGRTVKGRYLRFTALSEVNGRDFASAAEIGVVP